MERVGPEGLGLEPPNSERPSSPRDRMPTTSDGPSLRSRPSTRSRIAQPPSVAESRELVDVVKQVCGNARRSDRRHLNQRQLECGPASVGCRSHRRSNQPAIQLGTALESSGKARPSAAVFGDVMDHHKSSGSPPHGRAITSLVVCGVEPFDGFAWASWFTRVRKGVARGDSIRERSRPAAASRPRRIQSLAGDVIHRRSKRRPGSSRRIRPSGALLHRPNIRQATAVPRDNARRLRPTVDRVGVRKFAMVGPQSSRTDVLPTRSPEKRPVAMSACANALAPPTRLAKHQDLVPPLSTQRADSD